MRIAFVGCYGNGKTTLTNELSARLGLPRSHGSAMRDPAGGAPKSLEETNEAELIQLSVRRFVERAAEEAQNPRGFLSDGSVLHEWNYSRVRLGVGRFPDPSDSLAKATATASPSAKIYQEVVDQLGLLALEHARANYDLIIHCPAEFPLKVDPLPISEGFRVLSDQMMLETVKRLDAPVHIVTGSVEERIEQILKLPGVPSELVKP